MEIILRYLDGKSFLAISKVCQDLHYWCKTFFYYCKEDFWKNICYKELTTEQILGSCSGLTIEDWFLVYKSSSLDILDLRSRRFYTRKISLLERFKRHKTWIHFLGDLLVIIQGPAITVYNGLTGQLLGATHTSHINISHSYIVRKGYHPVHVSATCGYSYATSDMLVLLSDFDSLTRIAYVTPDSILQTKPVFNPLISQSNSRGCGCCYEYLTRNSVQLSPKLEVTATDENYDGDVDRLVIYNPEQSDDQLSSKLKLNSRLGDSRINWSHNQGSLQLEGRILRRSCFCGSSGQLAMDAKVIFDDVGTTPVIALLLMDDKYNKEVVLYGFL
ncbi:hypothetical protein EB796_012189 [Bugula neritina]|uniref:F-box domain-containing protein n=1 Tax=Bugula neritina TaxID=10212 RepID=A0A7J7JT03_BUGNE|nr:hypothetical protein EB796_012189 [Bugula neritina]